MFSVDEEVMINIFRLYLIMLLVLMLFFMKNVFLWMLNIMLWFI